MPEESGVAQLEDHMVAHGAAQRGQKERIGQHSAQPNGIQAAPGAAQNI